MKVKWPITERTRDLKIIESELRKTIIFELSGGKKTQKDLKDITGVSKPTIIKYLRMFEEEGDLIKERNPNDKRSFLYSLNNELKQRYIKDLKSGFIVDNPYRHIIKKQTKNIIYDDANEKLNIDFYSSVPFEKKNINEKDMIIASINLIKNMIKKRDKNENHKIIINIEYDYKND